MIAGRNPLIGRESIGGSIWGRPQLARHRGQSAVIGHRRTRAKGAPDTVTEDRPEVRVQHSHRSQFTAFCRCGATSGCRTSGFQPRVQLPESEGPQVIPGVTYRAVTVDRAHGACTWIAIPQRPSHPSLDVIGLPILGLCLECQAVRSNATTRPWNPIRRLAIVWATVRVPCAWQLATEEGLSRAAGESPLRRAPRAVTNTSGELLGRGFPRS